MARSFRRVALGVGTAVALALGSALVPTAAHAKVIDACTVELTAPEKISVGMQSQAFYVDVTKDGNGQTPGCVRYLDLNLVRTDDNQNLWGDYWNPVRRHWASGTPYQQGRLALEMPTYVQYSWPGVYELAVESAALNWDWAEANGVNPSDDIPRVVYTNNKVDVRFKAKVSLDAARVLGGVRLSGTATHFENYGRESGPVTSTAWVTQPYAKIALQKQSGSEWVTKTTVTADEDGAYATTIADTTAGTWRAEVQAGAEHWSAVSSAVPVGQASVANSVAPTISGTAAVGKKLTANPGAWSPAGVSFAYQWLRGGSTIEGATSSTYTLVAADAGKKVSVKVTGALEGYTTVTKASAAKTVKAGKLTATPKPKVTGTAKVGKKLKVKAGKWKPATVKLSYQWQRNGKKIKGATKSSYKLVKSDKGKKITVKVTGKKSGFTTVSKTSKATAKVK